MAKILYTALVADMRKKLNGSVMSKNRYGSIVRTKKSPRNPRTESQTTARGIFSANSASWRNLTDVQRNAWSAFAATISSFDVFKSKNVLTGQVAFVKLNTLLHSAGLPGLSEPPTESIIDTAFVVSALTTNGTDIEISLTTPDGLTVFDNNDYITLIDASPQLSAGVMVRAHGYFRIGNPDSDNVEVNVAPMYIAKFGNLIPGRKIFFRIRVLHVATGAVTRPVFTSIVIPEGGSTEPSTP